MNPQMKNNIPQGYKATPLGIIPKEWEVKKLGNIAQCFSGGTPNAGNNAYYGGNIPFIRSGEIHQKDTTLFLSELGLKESSAKMVQKGDLLMALYGANSGDPSVSQIDGAINQAILCIRPRNVSVYFLCHFLELNKDMYIAKYLQGGQGNLSGEIVLNYKISIPPLPEQQKIAEIINTWDKAIEKQLRLIEKLELRKKGVIQQILTAKRRLPGFSAPWKKVRLKEILIEGSKIPVDSTSKYKKISIGLYKKGISYIDNNKVKADIRPFYVRKKGEIIIGKQNYFNGSIAIINDKFDGTICSNAIMSFRVKNLFNLKFIYEAISQHDYLKKREMIANGTGQKELSEKDFLNFDTVVPSLEEQTAIAEVLTAADREIELAQQKLELLRQQKHGLMQQLLTGKKRVKL